MNIDRGVNAGDLCSFERTSSDKSMEETSK